VGMDLSLNLEHFEFLELDHDYSGDALLFNQLEDQFRLSYFGPYGKQGDVAIQLHLKSKKNGKLSELISIDQQDVNEIVSQNLKTYKPSLSFLPLQVGSENAVIYPNPTSNDIHILLPEGKHGISVYNSLGQRLLQKNDVMNKTYIDAQASGLSGLVHLVIISALKTESYSVFIQ
jgi:hypothetical protein